MSSFWTCGPFKEAADKLNQMIFKAEQTAKFMEVLDELKNLDEVIDNDEANSEDKILAALMRLDLEKKLEILIGVPDGHKEEDDEVSGKAVLESFKGTTIV